MKRIILLLVIVLGFTFNSNAQILEWARPISGITELTEITTDKYYNMYILAKTNNNSITIDGVSHSFDQRPINDSSLQYCVIKLDSNGSFIWAQSIGLTLTYNYDPFDIIELTHIRVTDQENIVLLGDIDMDGYATMRLNSTSDTTILVDNYWKSDQVGIFMIKLDKDGHFLWNKNMYKYSPWTRLMLDVGPGTEDIYLYTATDKFGTYDGTCTKIDNTGNIIFEEPLIVPSNHPDANRPEVGSFPKDKDYFYTYAWQGDLANNGKGLINKIDTAGNHIKTIELPVQNPTGLEVRTLTAALDDEESSYVYIQNQSKTIGGFSTPGNNQGLGYNRYLLKCDSAGNWKWMIPIEGMVQSNFKDQRLVYNNGILYLFFSIKQAGAIFNGYELDKAGTYLAEIDTSGEVISIKHELVPKYTLTQLSRRCTPSYKNNGIIVSGYMNGTLITKEKNHGTINGAFIGVYQETQYRIAGNIYYDLNNNSTQDVGEQNSKNIIVNINNNNVASFTNGDYTYRADTGNYTVSVPSVKYYNSNPSQYNFQLSASNPTKINTNFRLTPVDNINDLEVDLTNINFARPGQVAVYRLTVKNVGTTTLNSTLKFSYDDSLTFNSAGPPEDNHTGNELSWDIGNLAPFEIKQYTVTFTAPTTLTFNDTLCNSASISPITGDTTPENNVDTLYQEARASYDPNIKETNIPEVVNVDEVNGSFPIDYTIHFQNTGNDTAFHVYLIDSLDADLKVESIEVLSASHDYEMSISENNTLRWDYYNILLVDSNTNEPGSHGFVKYRVWTKDNPGLGDEFTNFADIYFDFNEPVRTNTTSNRIDKLESVELVKGKTVVVYPNPSNGVFTVKADIKAGTNAKVEVMDLTGKLVSTNEVIADATGLEAQIDINTLPQGIYFVKVYANDEVYTAKVIKQ